MAASTHLSPSPAGYEDPNEAIERGRKQVEMATRRFFRQCGMTQPKWIKLSNSLYQSDAQHLHSSQIGGLASGKLRDPSPKCLLVIGQLNQAVAAKSFPSHLKEMWEDLVPMVDKNGDHLGPGELFLAAAGQIDLGFNMTRDIPSSYEADVSQALGAYLRKRLIERGVDFIIAMKDLTGICPSVEPLLMGRQVSGYQVIEDLANLAEMIGESDSVLWSVCSDAMNF
jgi:hypothetical protein